MWHTTSVHTVCSHVVCLHATPTGDPCMLATYSEVYFFLECVLVNLKNVFSMLILYSSAIWYVAVV
jgi:hypothetical protein